MIAAVIQTKESRIRFSTLQLLCGIGCLALILAVAVPCVSIFYTLATPVEDNHNYGIGSEYTFKSFEIFTRNGSSFRLNPEELRSLEKSWVFGAHQVALKKIVTLEYRSELSDGYDMEMYFRVGDCNSVKYCDIWLVGSGGGFTVDVYGITIPLDSVFSDSRRSEFLDWIDADGNAGDWGNAG